MLKRFLLWLWRLLWDDSRWRGMAPETPQGHPQGWGTSEDIKLSAGVPTPPPAAPPPPEAPPPQDEPISDLYRPEERQIYRYFDGDQELRADPVELWMRMMDRGAEISIDDKVAWSASKDAPKAYRKLIERLRSLFGLRPFEDGGLSQDEVYALWLHFMAFHQGVKKNYCLLPSYSTAGWETSGPTSEGGPPTGNTADSPSTNGPSSTEGPPPSPSGSESPSGSSTPERTTSEPCAMGKDRPG